MTRRSALLATIAALVLVVPAPPATACSCAFEPPASHLRNASIAFVGAAEVTRDEEAGRVTTFRVERVYKGSPAASVDVTTARDEASCGVPFVEGRTYAVFASSQAESLTTGLCSGTTDDLSSISGLAAIEVRSPPGRAQPPAGAAGDARTAPIAVAGLLVALLTAASALAVRASRRPRPIA